MAKLDVYQIVTDRIIAQLEKGVVPWRKPWVGGEAINYVTRKTYRGVNCLLLDKSGEWMTFKQAKDAGGTIKKGEKSSIIVFYTMLDKTDDSGEATGKKIPFLKYSNVFHISQTEGVESKIAPTVVDGKVKEVEPIEAAEGILNDYMSRAGVELIREEASSAFYSPTTDSITLPELKQFENAEAFYSVAFHECAHSTGHKDRLDRPLTGTRGNDYSREELIAEITAAMVMSFAGFETNGTFANSAGYIDSWLKHLKADNRAIVVASGKAQKASDLILNLQ